MSLVMEATAQSPERRANSSASVPRKGRRTRRSVSSFDIRHARAAEKLCDQEQVISPALRRPAEPPQACLRYDAETTHLRNDAETAVGRGEEVLDALCGILHRPAERAHPHLSWLLGGGFWLD